MTETILARIDGALDEAEQALASFTAGAVATAYKSGDDPVTAADLAVDEALRRALLTESGEGWLSEETTDDLSRLDHDRVWIVDPLDGTREFVDGIPEWCVSVALVDEGRPVAGGILAPAAGHRIVGAVGHGVSLDGAPVSISSVTRTEGALVLASRSEVRRGEWRPFFDSPISVRNMGSVAYKLGLVAAGLADATWTLVPKNEWDVAAGTALVEAAGGRVAQPDRTPRLFNRRNPLLPGLVATAPGIFDAVFDLIESTSGVSPAST